MLQMVADEWEADEEDAQFPRAAPPPPLLRVSFGRMLQTEGKQVEKSRLANSSSGRGRIYVRSLLSASNTVHSRVRDAWRRLLAIRGTGRLVEQIYSSPDTPLSMTLLERSGAWVRRDDQADGALERRQCNYKL